MFLKEISIKNFRSIINLETTLNELTAICGSNSVGKSNILRALKFALREDHSVQKVKENISLFVSGSRTTIDIQLTFSRPTLKIQKYHKLARRTSFVFRLKATRSGSISAFINNIKLTTEEHLYFISCITIIDVPAVRDIENEGLKPFKQTLVKVLLKTKGSGSFSNATKQLCGVIEGKGHNLLNSDSISLSSALNVDDIAIETSSLNFDILLEQTTLKVKTQGNFVSLNKLGTGHQSTVILHLFRQLGNFTDDFVLYLFEEPDNHLHPSSLRAAATNFIETSKNSHSQVFLTTHSPRLLNQFTFESILALLQNQTNGSTEKRNFGITYDDKQLRRLLGKYTLTPAESLLAKKVVIVEGSMDVTAIRTFIELETHKTADQLDILIIPANGKPSVIELSTLMKCLDIEHISIMDYDAVENTHLEYFSQATRNSNGVSLISNIQTIIDSLEKTMIKKPRHQKILESMINEIQNGVQNS